MNRPLPLVLLLLALLPATAGAAEIAGVPLDERVTARDGTDLALHGAGVREKFFLDIYVGALYLPQSGQAVGRIRETDQPGRVEMHFVYDSVSREQLADAWRSGFAANNPREVQDTIADRIGSFINLFPDAKAGDTFVMEYVPGQGTLVRVNGGSAGTIPGGVFFRALLAVWLGPEPADADLKQGMLGGP